jgi:hypothetical protein
MERRIHKIEGEETWRKTEESPREHLRGRKEYRKSYNRKFLKMRS